MQTVSEEVFRFLEELKKNNNRDWFNEHKTRFKELESQMKDFYAEVEKLLMQHDDIERTKPFRIYRDVRFSKDKTPYKNHFSTVFLRRKPALRGNYYLHIEPGASELAVGFWQPVKEDLYRVRKEWEMDAEEIRAILNDKNLKKYWGVLQGEQLKTSPSGFDKEHLDIDLINYKQWYFVHSFTDEEVVSKDFAVKVDECCQHIRPFFDYMSAVLTTDLNGVSLLED